MRTGSARELTRRSRAARERGDAGTRATSCAALARATERAWVMTIHAFCRRLLATHPLAAGLDPRFRVLDAGRGRAAARAAPSARRSTRCSRAATPSVARAAAAYRALAAAAMTLAAHERLRSQGMIEPRLPAVGDPVQSPKARDEARDAHPGGGRRGDRRAGGARAPPRGVHAPLRGAEGGALGARLRRPRAAGARAAARARRSATLWRERFDHVMVDEFQDTNRVQLELVEALRGPETSVFMVGDELQSIYRFRNADLEVFRRERAARRAPTRTATCCRCAATSARGRRCSPPSTRRRRAARRLRRARPPARGPGRRARAPVELLLTLDEGRARTARRWDAEDIELDPPRRAPRRRRSIAEARLLAERLRELVDAGEAERGEIVVLLRAFTHVDAYEEALERAGLRPVRGRRPRLLVPAAGRGPAPAARRGRQPARRRGAVRRARLVRRAASAPTRSGCCARRRAASTAAPGTSGRCSSGASAASASPTQAEPSGSTDRAEDARSGSSASARSSRGCGPRRRCSRSRSWSSGR